MATVPTNRSSYPEEENCLFLGDSAWQESHLTDAVYQNLVAITSVISIAVLPTIFMNTLVIIAVATRHQLRAPSNQLLASMAGTDLFTGLIVQPVAIAVLVKRLLGDGPFCTLEIVYAEVGLAAVFASLSHLVLISIDRYIAVKKPLRYRHIVTKRRIKFGVIMAWSVTFCSRAQDLAVFVVDSETKLNFYVKVRTMILSVIILLHIAAIGYTYGYIFSESSRQKKRLKSEQLSHEEAKQVKKDNKAANTLVMIVGALLLSYLPVIITGALSSSSHNSKELMAVFWSWSSTFLMLGSLFNPLIYCWRFKNLRHAFLGILHLREPENISPEIEMAVIRRQRPEVQPSTSEAFSAPVVRHDPVLLSFRHLDAEEIVRNEGCKHG